MKNPVVVLNDGETFTHISGCKIIEIPDHVQDDCVDEYVSEQYVEGKGISVEELLKEYEKSHEK